MSEAKAAPKPKAADARKKASAASAEAKNEPKVVDFRGLELRLPAKLPGTVLFDLADIDAGRDLVGTMEFIKSLIGEGQYAAVRQKIRDDEVTLDETEGVLLKLLEDILDASGIGSGE